VEILFVVVIRQGKETYVFKIKGEDTPMDGGRVRREDSSEGRTKKEEK